MKLKLIFLSALLAAGCTDGDKTLLFECEQNTGEACNKVGKKREGAEAVKYFRRACELENTNGCVNLAERIKGSERAEALRVLKYACDRGNTDGCVKFAELSQAGAAP
jgi:TPR repeat protein